VANFSLLNDHRAAFASHALVWDSQMFPEKPLGITRDECAVSIEASEHTGRPLALGHELRLSRQRSALREIVAKGDIGQLRLQRF
jgi:predicted dehydrogenase